MHRLLKKSAIWGCPCWVQELSAIWDHYLQTSPELQIQQMTAQQNRICASALCAFIVKWDLLFLDQFVCNVLLFRNGSTSETRVLKWVGHEMTKRLYDAVVMQEILCQLFFPLHHALQCSFGASGWCKPKWKDLFYLIRCSSGMGRRSLEEMFSTTGESRLAEPLLSLSLLSYPDSVLWIFQLSLRTLRVAEPFALSLSVWPPRLSESRELRLPPISCFCSSS